MNCHAYCERDPSRMMFHARADLAGTLILQDGLVEKLDAVSYTHLTLPTIA